MDHGKVLKRAWEILWQYRVLWVFGVIVALCATSPGANPNLSYGGGGQGNNQSNALPWLGALPSRTYQLGEVVPEVLAAVAAVAGVILALIVALCCLAVIVTVARIIFLYVGETALIRMVNDHEETGEKHGVREGLRLGWSRTALRLFVIDLLTRVPAFVLLLFLLLLGVGLLGLFVLLSDGAILKIIGVVAGIGVGFLFVLAMIVLALAISLVRPLIFRVCALEERGVIDSFRVGFDFIKAHLGDTAIMWLIMVGLQIGWVIAMIPVVLFLVVVGGIIAGILGLTVGGLASLAFSGAVPWIVGFGVGLPLFILILASPLVFLGGLAEVFKSSVWTLTYRELRALEGLENSSGKLPAAAEGAA
jgi:hypothetical protein